MRKFKTTNGNIVCITKATKKSLVEMTRNFQENPFEFKNVKITICYKNGRFESYSFYNIDKEKISYSTIKSITYFDGTQYLYYGGFYISPNGKVIASETESIINGEEIKEDSKKEEMEEEQPTRTFIRDNPFMKVTVQKISLPSAIKELNQFIKEKSSFDERQFTVILPDGNEVTFTNKSNWKETFKPEEIGDIIICDDLDYQITSHFTLYDYGGIDFSGEDYISPAWFEVPSISSKNVAPKELYPEKMFRESTPEEIKKSVEWYLTKGRFYEQENKPYFAKILLKQLEAISNTLELEEYLNLKQELIDIIREKDMVPFFVQGDKRWTTTTFARIALQKFKEKYIEESFMEEFTYMAKTSSFACMYRWVAVNYDIDLMQLSYDEEGGEVVENCGD